MTATGAPLLLLRAAQVFAPAPLGATEVLIGGGKILAVGRDLMPGGALPGLVEQRRLDQGWLIPGLVDGHQHFIGGGEGDGARMPELRFEDIVAAGITTAVGLLGSEVEAKTLPLLLRKAHELARAGLAAHIYTGGMPLPAPYITQSVRADIVQIERVIGAKSAISERTFPNLDFPTFATLAGSLVQAKAMCGKAAVLHLHVGRLRSGLEPLFELVERMGFAPAQAVPSHVNRVPEVSPVFEQACRYAKQGGTIDVTACLGPLDFLPSGIDAVEAVLRALDAGVAASQITISSDAGVAVPDGSGGARPVEPTILWRDLTRLAGRIGWAEALPFVTANVARVLGLAGRKGAITTGMDADLVAVGEDGRIAWTMCGGRIVHESRPLDPQPPTRSPA